MIIGIDEVGRGAWAGPLLIAAVKLELEHFELKDSKTLGKNEIKKLSRLIKREAPQVSFGWVSNLEIDDIGLTAATKTAIIRALNGFDHNNCEIIIDGKVDYLNWKNSKSVIGADNTIAAVSAASIVAKDARDNLMKKMHILFPDYSFNSNVGYGTSKHRSALAKHGPTRIHRISYQPVRELNEHRKGTKS